MTMAYITDLVEPRDYPNAFAYANATSSAAIIVGPLFGGLLEARAGFDAGFLIAAGLQALALAVALVFLQVPRGATTLAAPATLGETLATLRHPAVRPLLLQQATATLAINGWFAIATLSITILLGVGAGRASETFAMFGIWTFVMEVFVVGRLINRFGARVSSNLSLASLTASFLLFAFTHDYATLVGVFVLFSFGFAVHEATMPAMLSARVTAGQRGMVLEASQTVENVTKVVVPPISTGVLGIFGPGVATGLSAVLSAGALGMGLALAGKEPRDVRSSPR
jgi:predicted MFS family arabinose efflux permease